MPWEQDQPAKLAQVHALISNEYQLSESPDLYRKNQFPLYYLILSAFTKLYGINDYFVMNILAIVSGGIFYATAVSVCRSFFNLQPAIALAVFLSCPSIFISFTYGNEAGFALMFLALALFLILGAKDTFVHPILAGFALVASALCRLDYVVFIPLFSLFLFVSKDQPCIKLNKTRILQALTLLVFSLFGFVFFYAFFVKQIPSGGSFEYNFNLKQTAAYLVYGLGFFLVLPAFLGLWKQFKRNWFVTIIFLLILSHAIAYAQMFSSPKYILPFFFVSCIFATIGLTTIWKLSKLGALVILLLPWATSITPFGLKWGTPGALYFIPTDDGPLPSGSYFSFYKLIREGFFQQRYLDEETQIKKAMNLLPQFDQPFVAGFFNQQTSIIIGARKGDLEFARTFWPNPNTLPPCDETPAIMIKTSYLHPRRMSLEMRNWFEKKLVSGSIIPLTDEDDPFPDVILIQGKNHPYADMELARRIRSLFEIGGVEQWLQRNSYIKEFQGTSWRKVGEFWELSENQQNATKFYSLKSPVEILRLNKN